MPDREFTNINGIKVCDQTARESIPTKTSELTNDSDFATNDSVDTKIANAQLGGNEVDLSSYAKKSDIPTKTSQLTNDSGYITSIPGEYITENELNDKGYATTSQIPTVPTNISAFTNDSNYATQTYVTNKIAEAQLGGGEVDTNGFVTKETGNANQITFSDGQTFQAKLDAGTLKGDKGDKGDAGAQGPAGVDGLTTSIVLNGVTYTQQNGVITLPNISSGGEVVPVAQVEPAELDMPKVFFNGGKPTTKDSVYATIEYVSSNEHFKGYVDIKCQGTSSMAYPKKNYTIKIYTDEARTTKLKKDFKGWGKQNKFCLKANYIDHSHARNVVSAKLWGEVVSSRSDYSTLPELLRTSPNNGAVDGFPIKVYYNNTYEGVYTWNIPKDGWMNNMDDTLDTHCILCGEEYDSGCFRSANASLWSDELHDVMPANIVTSFNAFQNFVINSTDEEFVARLSEYADVNSLIDYYIFNYVICGLDSMGKNQLFFTYDGIKWIASAYDMDSTFGMYWNGQSFVSATYRMQEDYESMVDGRAGNLLYIRLEDLFIDAIKTRYAELRANVLSYANIVDKFERFMDIIGKDLYAEDLTIYTGIPNGSTNNIQQIRNYTRDRLTYVDAQIEALTPAVPCTGITLSANNLSFTTTDTQTLTATVEPSNTTDVVTWSVSPTDIVTVDGGVVTPVTNGDCTITATCGSYSATCTVNVALPEVECTSISLDKTELSLGQIKSDTSDLEVNLLDGVEWSDGALSIDDGTIKANNTEKYTQINVNKPGKYTLSSTVGYFYKKLTLHNTDGTFISSTGDEYNANDCTINITKPCIVKIGLFLNNLDWDASAVSLIRASFDDITNRDVTHTLTASDINVKYTGTEYVYVELFLDKLYNDLVIVKYDGNICTTIKKNIAVTNDTDLNSLVIAKNSGYINTHYYMGKTFLNAVLPITYGTTADAILSNMTSTTITINPTDELAKFATSSTNEVLSAQLKATVTPDNCTQPIIWSVSPEGIATVNNGLVTAKANGSAVITATCGTQSATCNVTVSGIS